MALGNIDGVEHSEMNQAEALSTPACNHKIMWDAIHPWGYCKKCGMTEVQILHERIAALEGHKQHSDAVFALARKLGQSEYDSKSPATFLAERIAELESIVRAKNHYIHEQGEALASGGVAYEEAMKRIAALEAERNALSARVLVAEAKEQRMRAHSEHLEKALAELRSAWMIAKQHYQGLQGSEYIGMERRVEAVLAEKGDDK